MDSPPKEKSTMTMARRRTQLVQELINGQNITTELEVLLKKPPSDQQLEQTKSLVQKLWLCFSNARSIVESGAAGDDGRNLSMHFGDRGIKDSGENKKIPAAKDRRGCYKRRRTSEVEATVTANPFTDGHSWRKYGQKDILGSKYPRSYFRCTHKHDQHCQAVKQVQQTEDNPSMYRVTYMGHHTCKDPLKASQLVLDSSSSKEPFMLHFESHSTRNQECKSMLFSALDPIKQEVNEDMPSDLTQTSSPSSDYIFPPDFATFGSCEPLQTFSMAGSDATSSFSIIDTADFNAFFDAVEFS